VTQELQKDSMATRRGVLAGVGLVGLAGAITACGSSASSSSTPAGNAATSAAPTAAAPTAAAGGGASASASASTGTGSTASGALTATSAIPVGSGMIFAAKQVVVTQPTAGEYKAFSAICTHMGCTVSQISNGTIDCPCHGSQYSIKDGAVVAGPAPKPLPAEKIKVTGDSIFLA
jgi:Rieske Fe-S protein